jgi:hypothetical protein
MKNNNNNTYISSFGYSSRGHALSTFSFSFNARSTYSSNEWLIDLGTTYNMARDKSIFYALNSNVIPNKYVLVMIDLLVF